MGEETEEKKPYQVRKINVYKTLNSLETGEKVDKSRFIEGDPLFYFTREFFCFNHPDVLSHETTPFSDDEDSSSDIAELANELYQRGITHRDEIDFLRDNWVDCDDDDYAQETCPLDYTDQKNLYAALKKLWDEEWKNQMELDLKRTSSLQQQIQEGNNQSS
ncbi:hypothetical protein KY349_04785 [Candidatus Woesearchaeota archaeon]|nr:hypothetical protein [Candidatus Woesearchaeota archaeon]